MIQIIKRNLSCICSNILQSLPHAFLDCMHNVILTKKYIHENIFKKIDLSVLA